MYNELFAYLAEKDVKYKRRIKLSEYSSVRIGGEADFAIFPDTAEKLEAVLRYLYLSHHPFAVVGNMTNILADDTPYEGVVVFTREMGHFRFDGECVTAECGVNFSSLITRCSSHSLGGMESLFGIPGTVGGMIYSNAGAFGNEISDFLISVTLYDVVKDKRYVVKNEDMLFSYRNSLLKKDKFLFILDATFRFVNKDIEKISAEIKRINEIRKAKQPISFPSLGSVFVRLTDVLPARLIDESGFKGYRIGGAEVSEKHAGFIVNLGDATARDFKELIEHIKNEIHLKYGVRLVEEIEYLSFLPQNK